MTWESSGDRGLQDQIPGRGGDDVFAEVQGNGADDVFAERSVIKLEGWMIASDLLQNEALS